MASQPVAVAHHIGEDMGVAHEFPGPDHVSLREQAADIGGADGDPFQLHLADDVAAQAVFPAVLAQTLRIALALPAKMKVIAHHEVDAAQLSANGLEEFLPGHAHGLLGEAKKLHPVDAEQLPDEPGPVRGAVDEGHRLPPHQGVGMGVKGHDGRLTAQLPGPFHGALQQRRVAPVDAVEKAQGQNAVSLCLVGHFKPRKSF